jgi:DNA-binding transcriptional ArsR family regulator
MDRDPCCEPLGDLLEPRLFKALCEPSRLTILGALAEAGKPLSVGDIAEQLPIDFSVVSRHLAILKEAGVVDAEKRGKAVYYAMRYERLADTFRAIAGAIEQCCPPEAGKTNQKEDTPHG